MSKEVAAGGRFDICLDSGLHFHEVHGLFSQFGHDDRRCSLKFFDAARCRHFNSTSSPPPSNFSLGPSLVVAHQLEARGNDPLENEFLVPQKREIDILL